ncbi:Low-density lipoprotein receptor-related protein 4 [Nymphon striatum]|nr:Low-density lipoprotein receptor-related protein 4 [Nymphon striatum]
MGDITCSEEQWACADSSQCININRRCNYEKDCQDESDEENCGPQASILLADRTTIRWISINESKYKTIYSSLTNTIAVDYHYLKGLLYWCDIAKMSIKRSFLPFSKLYNQSNQSHIKDIITIGLGSPGGIAVDWVNDKLYWTDTKLSRIELSDLEGKNRKVLLWKNIGKPRAIVVHPQLRLLLWTDWGDYPRIESVQLDGSNRSVIVSTGLSWPNGLTIDYPQNKLYWLDAKNHVIEKANMDGSDRIVLIRSGIQHPFAIAIFEEFIYWTDWKTKNVNKANKFTGVRVPYHHSNLNFPMDIHIVHPLRQPKASNPCTFKNGGCSHICLPNQSSYICTCPTEMQLKDNGSTCYTPDSKFLVFTRRSDIRRLTLSYPLYSNTINDSVDAVIPLSGISSAVALDWESEGDYIYWSDVTNDSISRSHWNGSNQEIVIERNVNKPAGLAIDWVTKKLYWTDDGSNRIEVSNLDGSMRSILVWIDLDKPRDIIVDPIGGYMYWTDWGEVPKIERAGMDGTQRTVIVGTNLTWPNGLAIDYENETLYWTDAGMKAIECSNLDGTNRKSRAPPSLFRLLEERKEEEIIDRKCSAGRRTLIRPYSKSVLINSSISEAEILRGDLPHPFGLTLHEDRIYWTDWKTKSIASINKQTGRNKIVHAQNLENLMDIHVFDENIRQHYPTPCTSNNGGCSHLCLLAPLNKGYSCACPTGITLIDSRTCTNEVSSPALASWHEASHKLTRSGYGLFELMINKDLCMMNFFVIARRSDLRLISFDVDYFADVILPIKELKDAIAVDVDRKTGRVYWSDSINQKIMSCDMTGSNIRSVLSIGIRSAYGIAVDSTGRKIYWTDAIKQKIEVSTLDGSLRKVLIGRNLDSPRAIVLHYHYGVMFWADWGNQPRIERADMDGNNRKVIVSENLGWPNGLTIDRPNSQLYWADAKTKVIEASDLEGKNRRVLVSSVQHPYGVTILGEHVYWTDWELQAVVRASKETGGGRQILQDGVPGLMDIHAVQLHNIERSACGTDNGGCSHLCLRQPKGLSCACPTGIHLKPDKRTCFEYPHKSLLFVSTKKIQRISFDTDDATNVPLQIPDVRNAIGLSYHYRLGRLYFTDVDLDVIRSRLKIINTLLFSRSKKKVQINSTFGVDPTPLGRVESTPKVE